MNTDPATATPRADLTFLRRRVRPRPPAAAAPAAAAAAASAAGGGARIDYSRPDRARHNPAAAAAPAAAAPASRPKIDFSRPDRRPAASPTPATAPGPAAPRAPAAPATSSGSLDLSASSAPAAPPSGGVDYARRPSVDSLDLSSAPAPSAPAPAAALPTGPALRRHEDRHVLGREQVLLSVKTPTVTLTRVQSGVGHMTIEAVCSDEVGDLRLGAVYQFRSGGTSTVQHVGGNRFAPSSRRPVIVAGRETYERLSIDLRQVGDIERISVYAFSEARQPLHWGGTLVADTFGGGRIELPLETLYESTVAVLLSLCNLDGELVVRAEMESIVGDVREAARAYGFDRIAWRDDRSPVD